MNAVSQLPPHDDFAERAVLGGLMRFNRIIDRVSLILSASDFHKDCNAKVYAAIEQLRELHKPFDVVTIGEELRRQQVNCDFGDGPESCHTYLQELWDDAETGGNAPHWAQIVRSKSIIRGVIHTASELLQDCYDQKGPAEEILAEAEQRIFALAHSSVQGNNCYLAAAIDAVCDQVDDRSLTPNVLPGISTGFRELDDILGGFQKGELTIIAARPSCGKTSVALALMRTHILTGGTAFFVSLEQSRMAIARRLLAAQANVNTHILRTGDLRPEETRRLQTARNVLRDRKLIIDDDGEKKPSYIVANARRLKASDNIGMLVLDYIQLIEPEDKRANKEEQIGQAARKLRALAKELDIPVIILAQLNREVEGRTNPEPKLADLRDSGQLEQHADVVWLLWNPRPEAGEIEGPGYALNIKIGKNRDGQLGLVRMTHYRGEMRFESSPSHSAFSA